MNEAHQVVAPSCMGQLVDEDSVEFMPLKDALCSYLRLVSVLLLQCPFVGQGQLFSIFVEP